MSEIVVVGSLNMDLVVKTARAPAAGETVPGQEFRTVPGGKGANQAAAAARLGGSVTMVGRVGRDAFGSQMRANLAEMGVDTRFVTIDAESPSGIASIVVDEHGQNWIIVVAGANGNVAASDIDAIAGMIREVKLLILQFEIPMDTVVHAAALAREEGVLVILNPAPASTLPAGLWTCVSYLILNESEASLLSGTTVKDLESARSAGDILLNKGAGSVIITLGAQGALLVTPDKRKHFPARTVDALDTTAAGDAFVGAFALELARAASLEDAVRFAVAAGSITVTRFGAQTSLPRRAEVEAFLRES